MHALHSLAHRAPPATRTRVRWQPYNNSISSISIPSRSPAPYLITPASSVSSSPPQASTSQLLKDFPFRDSSRNKYAIGLVDQAVKSLSEIWRPQDIPGVFLSSSRAMVSIGPSHESNHISHHNPSKRPHNHQLPSPVSPSTKPSPPSPALSLPDQDTSESRDTLVPIKGFVHEVLRRSRTSGCVLQTALCYLEAIRTKIPELARQEKAGIQLVTQPDRIAMATEAELQAELDYNATWDSILNTDRCLDDDVMATVRAQDGDLDASTSFSQHPDTVPKPSSTNGTCSPPSLPSPLLCPRRAFLASLILASKFTQDKCYSNRAWAKLSGLPPREIGRCERALGEALEWRLWVGKPSAPPQPAPPAVKRPVVRSQSESSLLHPASSSTAFLAWNEKGAPSAAYPSPSRSTARGLRRSATLPAERFTAPIAEDPSSMGCDTLLDSDQDDQIQSATSSIMPTLTYASSCSMDIMGSSPSPPTPGLSYSPSSTESSSGDRTIQMSTFADDSMTPFSSSYRGFMNSAMCPWLDNPAEKEYPPVLSHCQATGEKHREPVLAPPLVRLPGEHHVRAPPPDSLSHPWPLDISFTSPFGQ